MKLAISLFTSLCISWAAWASPGAHGPNGEHLDSPSVLAGTDATPRFEAFTENFEMVGKLYDTEMSVMIDRYQTNEPVLQASLVLSLDGNDYPATFHADAGDYAFDHPPVLKALRQPGTHELIFTLTHAEESDLLLATFVTGDQIASGHHGAQGSASGHNEDHGHSHEEATYEHWLHSAILPIAGILFMVLLAALVGRRIAKGGTA